MTEIQNLPERLRQGQEAFNESSAEGGYVNDWPPDGTYQAIVKRFDFFESKKGDVFLKTELQIAFDREYAGREVETIHNLTDPELLRAGWLKTHLKRLGAQVDELDLTQVGPGSTFLEALLDVPVEIAIKTSDKTNAEGEPYRNTYVNKRIGDALNGGGGVIGGPRNAGKVQSQSDVPADDADFQEAPAGAGAQDDDENIPF